MKCQRRPRIKNDGRPPDTTRRLLWVHRAHRQGQKKHQRRRSDSESTARTTDNSQTLDRWSNNDQTLLKSDPSSDHSGQSSDDSDLQSDGHDADADDDDEDPDSNVDNWPQEPESEIIVKVAEGTGSTDNAFLKTARGYSFPRDRGIPGYKWDRNSCWIDTSMQLLYIGLQPDWSDFEVAFRGLSAGDPLSQFFNTFNRRRTLERDHKWDVMEMSLMQHRDDLRDCLYSAGDILAPGKRKNDHHSCLVCPSMVVYVRSDTHSGMAH